LGPGTGLDDVRREKSCTARNRTWAVQPDAIPTELSQLPLMGQEIAGKRWEEDGRTAISEMDLQE
jgi:hypothetical protein